MNNFFEFLSLIKNELSSLAAVIPSEVAVIIGMAFTFIVVLAMMRIVALIEDDIPFV